MTRCELVAAFAVAIAPSGIASAGVSIPAFSQGHIDFGGLSSSGSYAVGDPATGEHLYRNWFVFDLAGQSQRIVSGQLHVYNPAGGFESADATETYTLFDYAGDPQALADGFGGVPVYDDLGSGDEFGGYLASAADNDSTIIIDLNADALASINASLGELWAVGGAITTLDGITSLEGLFLFSGDVPLSMTQLVVTPIPAPGALLLLGLAAVRGARRRRVCHSISTPTGGGCAPPACDRPSPRE